MVLPKLQYCRVIRRLCDSGVICGRLIDNSSPYDAVDRHFCNFFPPCERDFRIASGPPVACEKAPPRRIGLPVPAVPPPRPPMTPAPPPPLTPIPLQMLERSGMVEPVPPDDAVAVDPHSPFICSIENECARAIRV